MPGHPVRILFSGVALCTALLGIPAPALAGSDLITADTDFDLFLGVMLRQFCVDTFPRFAKAASVIDSANYFHRRPGKKVWDHTGLAVTMSLPKIDGRPACVMTAFAKTWTADVWAAFAVSVFGDTWASDETIIDRGAAHPGDNWEQHITVRFPTHERFVFDADRRSNGLWVYTISLIAAK